MQANKVAKMASKAAASVAGGVRTINQVRIDSIDPDIYAHARRLFLCKPYASSQGAEASN
jgi:hypothetical protein